MSSIQLELDEVAQLRVLQRISAVTSTGIASYLNAGAIVTAVRYSPSSYLISGLRDGVTVTSNRILLQATKFARIVKRNHPATRIFE